MADKIRILHVIGTFNIGGMEANLLNFFEHADFDGFEHHVFVGRDSGRLRERFHRLPLKITQLRTTPKHYFYSLPQGIRYCRRHRIGILHGHNYWAYLYCCLLSILARVPFIAGDYGLGTWKGRIHHAWESFVFRRAAVNIAVSRSIMEKDRALVERGGDMGGKFEIVFPVIRSISPETLHPEREKEIKRSLGIDNDLPVLTVIGRIIRLKGHRFAIEAVKKINEAGQRVNLLIVGRPAEPGVLPEEDLAREDVHFLDYYEHIEDIWTVTDLFLIPSTSEGTPLVLLEYFAIGRPVIASDISGNRELIRDGWNGFLFEKGNVDELIAKIERAIAMSAGEMSLLLENASRYYRERLSPAVQTRKTEEFYARFARGVNARPALP